MSNGELIGLLGVHGTPQPWDDNPHPDKESL
jgi:hypothetical protein